MVCRQNRISSVVMAMARSESWLDDAQVQSIIHRLRHEYDEQNPGQALVPERVDAQIDRTRARIQRSPILRSQRRAGLLNRLEQGRSEADQLLPGMAWALERLSTGVAMSEAALDSRLREIAGTRGMSHREARAEFFELRSQAPSGRQPRATAEERADLGVIPSDPATRFALREMAARDPVLPPVRLVQRWIPVRQSEDPTEPTAIGISDLSNRIEMRNRDGSIRAFRPSSTGQRILTNFAGTWSEVSSPSLLSDVLFDSDEIARPEQTAHAIRCDDCGQFIGDSPHACPGLGTRATIRNEYRADGDDTSLLTCPPSDEVRELMEGNIRAVRARISYTRSGVTVEGDVILRAGADAVRTDPSSSRQVIDLDESAPNELACGDCFVGTCSHVTVAREAIRRHYRDAGRLSPSEQRQGILAARGITSASTTSAISTTPREQPDTTSSSDVPATISFRDDPDAFRRVIDEARQDQRDRGLSMLEVPLLAGTDALDPAARQHPTGGATRFGLEIEFNSEYGNSYPVASRLHEAGFIAGPSIQPYHSSARAGYDEWNLERDSSVPGGGELVTPILVDTAATWSTLDEACQVLNDSGATTHGAGCHTNISAAFYTPEAAWRLARLVRMHEDDLFRMGRTRGSRRTMAYAERLGDPGPAWQDWHVVRRRTWRESMVNFVGAGSASAFRQRIEFRFPDASLDAGVMQAQVNLCAAMANYARDHEAPPLEPRPLGTARSEGWTRRLMVSSDPEFEVRTERIRGLIDDLLTTDRARSQAALLWARGSYHR